MPQWKLRFIVITDRKCSDNFAKRKLPLECPVERLKNESLPVNRPAVTFVEQSLPVELATERIFVKTYRKHESIDEKLPCRNGLRKKVRTKRGYKERNKKERVESLLSSDSVHFQLSKASIVTASFFMKKCTFV